jgi:Zn finger protein HypA/HybF involved in hydrogenase expression
MRDKEIYWHWVRCDNCKLKFGFKFIVRTLDSVLPVCDWMCPKCRSDEDTVYDSEYAEETIPTIEEVYV